MWWLVVFGGVWYDLLVLHNYRVIISECQKVKSLPLEYSLAVGSRGSHNRKRFALVAAGNHCH